ncbi:hypothetical protein HDV03_005435 [Kappamyces sp. JEL0829]|nr:hypothetical protein HDV03_005435 [Kappamyces sp. JEL0829]
MTQSMSFVQIATRAYCSSDIVNAVRPERHRPVVLLCGWLDAKPDHLFKYAGLYVALGYSVVVLESDSFDMTLRPSIFVHYSAARRVFALVGNAASFVAAVFSNGGLRSFFCFTDNYPAVLRIQGLIIDSAPSVLKSRPLDGALVRQIYYTTIQPAWLRFLLLESLVLALHLTKAYYWLRPQSHWMNVHLKRLSSAYPSVPRLFLYSDADQAIPSSDIRTAIQHSLQNSAVVESVNFKTSPHVQHLLHHRERYTKTVTWFLDTYVYRPPFSKL